MNFNIYKKLELLRKTNTTTYVVFDVLANMALEDKKEEFELKVEDLEEILNMSGRTIRRAIKDLKDNGYIEIINRRDENGKILTNIYKIL
ncbi:HTH domain-containing protein [Clostridium paraputrificum]|uniref:HTH domain-containing protein n=1 Tax=Clostridium paraputrificum TaxID=29363 RepID=UPI0004046D5E|nr:HTH domain-containing protein [Clostridium paraputrificum]